MMANIAIAGCGAVSMLYYAPALALLQQQVAEAGAGQLFLCRGQLLTVTERTH